MSAPDSRKTGLRDLCTPAGVALVLQSVVFETVARTASWDAAMRGYASIPPLVLLVVGILAGALVAATGWRAGKPPSGQRSPREAAPAAS